MLNFRGMTHDDAWARLFMEETHVQTSPSDLYKYWGYPLTSTNPPTAAAPYLAPKHGDMVFTAPASDFTLPENINPADAAAIAEKYGVDRIFVDMEFKGKKKGLVGIVIYLYLTNGQTLECEFEGKIK